MSLFSIFSQWATGLRRSQGIQTSGPLTYDSAPAATVNFDTAMQISAVWACVKLLAETTSSLPFTLYKKTEKGRKVAQIHPLTTLFSGKVNRYQNAIEFFETMLLNLVTTGNAYVLKTYSGGMITSLMPLMSAQMEVEVLADGAVIYKYSHSEGVTVIATENMWHVKLMGNGVIGLSPMDHQRTTVGIAIAAEGAVTKIYRNGAKPSGVLSMDRMLTPTQRTAIRANFATLTSSEDDRLMVLEGGMKFNSVSLSPQDIELLASRKHQISEICRWYGVPSVLINDANGTSVWGSGIEQIMEAFYRLTLRPLLEKIELSARVNLLSAAERDKYEFEFDLGALLRSSDKERFEKYRVGISSGVMTPNEARAEESWDKMPGGDSLYIQGAMVPIEMAGKQQQQPAPVQPPDTQAKELLTSIHTELRVLSETSRKSAPPPPQQAAVTHNHFAMPEQKHTVNVHNPAVTVNIPETVVNVEAQIPEQKQINPVVNVYNEIAPAGVTVIDNHPTQAVQRVERNANDEIVRTVIDYRKD